MPEIAKPSSRMAMESAFASDSAIRGEKLSITSAFSLRTASYKPEDLSITCNRISRQFLLMFAQELGRLEEEAQKEISRYCLPLNQIQARVVSFEEQSDATRPTLESDKNMEVNDATLVFYEVLNDVLDCLEKKGLPIPV